MSRLETAAQPLLTTMLRGHRRTFYRGGQETLAGWTIKTALALGMLHLDRYEPITAQHYRRMAQANGRPDEACQVFLGAYGGTTVVNHQIRRLAINADEDDALGQLKEGLSPMVERMRVQLPTRRALRR
ncbi:MAG TPA: hypothetical protein VFF79_18610 [Conexibacter sp.]|jgi:hypothetical protein|nr:hypothetical protein [Conexibacter sp.]